MLQNAKVGRPIFGGKAAKDQGVRMRRLRPRQVLCSQCRSICNENSENVQMKSVSSDSKLLPPPATSLSTQIKYTPSEQTVPEISVPRGILTRSSQIQPQPPTPKSSEPDSTPTANEYRASSVLPGKMVLRKRRLDEEPEEATPAPAPMNQNMNVSSEARSTETPPVPVLRISFANAEGAVVKIASSCDAGTKAARKALKKAKKEAQRRGQQNLAPEESSTSFLPRRHRKHHKRKRKRRDENEADEEDLLDIQEQGWGCNKGPFTEADLRPAEGLYEEVRNNCLRQKLSISLKRLSAQAYARLSPKHGSHHRHHHHHGHHHNHLDELPSLDDEDVGSDDGSVPDFPRHEPLQPHPQAHATGPPAQQSDSCRPLMMRITSQNVNQCVLEGGREMSVGDVVWGKIHGFPWWPGKVLSLTVSRREGGSGTGGGVPVAHQAHVAWFGSSTSSYMPCHQLAPFLRHFKARYNRKKRGPYKEAIRQAQFEAQRLQPPSSVPPPLSIAVVEPVVQQVT